MTHKPLSNPTLADILRAAKERFNDGNGMAVSSDSHTQGMCVYSNGSNACVLGYMLPEGLASKFRMVGGVESLIERLGAVGILHEYQWLIIHRDVLEALQSIHDTQSNWDDVWLNDKGRHAFNILCKSVGQSILGL